MLITPTSARVKSQWNVASLVAVRYSMPLIPRTIGFSTPLNSMSPRDVYAAFLDMQQKRELLSVTTGKRIYKNMLIRGIEVTTDKTTENVLSITLTLREVILTSTQKIQVAAKADMALGENTAASKNAGTKSLRKVRTSP